MIKRHSMRLIAALLAVMLMLTVSSCASSQSEKDKTSQTTAPQNQAVEDVPGHNTGGGEDKTDAPVVSPEDPALPGQPSAPEVQKSERDMSKGLYSMPSNIPPLSPDGIQGKLKEVYYTKDGGLAVTLNLSNGMAAAQRVTEFSVRITGDQNIFLTEQVTVKPDDCRVAAGGYADVYFEIDKAQVLAENDPLTTLVSALSFTTIPVDEGSSSSPVQPIVLDGKSPVDGLSFYEDYTQMPALSADAVNATVVSARYSNDGSLLITLMLSNGADTDKTVTHADVTILNATTGVKIASQTFDDLSVSVPSKGTTEHQAVIDQANVLMKYDSLQALTVNVSVK